MTKVQGIIAEQLGTDVEKIGSDVKFVDLGADSLDTVEIMMALEEEFDITLDEEGKKKKKERRRERREKTKCKAAL